MANYRPLNIIIILFTAILALYGIRIMFSIEGFRGGSGGGSRGGHGGRGGLGRYGGGGGGHWRNYGGSYGGSGWWSYGYPYGWTYGWPFSYSEHCYRDRYGIVRCDRPVPEFY